MNIDERIRAVMGPVNIEEYCRRWKIVRMELFGSVLRDDFRPDSDVDILIEIEKHARWGLLDFIRMEEEIREILHRRVDLIERSVVETSPNWIRRDSILGSTRLIYAE